MICGCHVVLDPSARTPRPDLCQLMTRKLDTVVFAVIFYVSPMILKRIAYTRLLTPLII